MSRFIRRSAIALPALLIALTTGAAVALPAQAASTWSAALPLPFGVGSQGFAENASGMQVAASTTGAQGESSVVVATSSTGLTWSAPLTLDAGENPAVAIAPSGRAVAAWEGGPATAAVIQASVRPPGGTWSAPVNVSTDAFGGPVIGMDGSGNAIVAWTGGGKQIRTASLPAGGSWTAVDTLDPAVDGFALGLAVNSAGSAIVTWAEPARTIMAASGTILGGFGAPVTLAADVTRTPPASSPAAPVTLDAYETPALGGIPQVNSAYLHGHTDVVLSNSGEASLASALTTTATLHNVTTRSAAGTWSAPMGLPLPGPSSAEPDYETAIDGAGDVVTVYQQGTSVDLIRLPAGSSTWSTPVVLAASASLGMVGGDTAGTFVAAVDTSSGLSVLTSPPGGSFGAATTLPATALATALVIDPGHAVLIAGGSVFTEPVS
jgi:hypothetical protein